MAKQITVQEALIYSMVTLSAADTRMTDRELAKIGDIVRSLPIFGKYDEERLVPDAKACGAILQEEDGLDRVLELIAETVPPRLHETAYALTVEVAAADLHVEQEELRFLALLRNQLEIDPLVSAAIERSARARYRQL